MKSVLVIDTPSSCVTCPLSFYNEYWSEYECRGREYYRTIDNYEWQKKQMYGKDDRPEWCPLLSHEDALILPHTIGNITFYNKKELIDYIKGETNELYR